MIHTVANTQFSHAKSQILCGFIAPLTGTKIFIKTVLLVHIHLPI